MQNNDLFIYYSFMIAPTAVKKKYFYLCAIITFYLPTYV